MKNLILIILVCWWNAAFSQTTKPCPPNDCNCILAKGDNYTDAAAFDKALNAYFAAKNCYKDDILIETRIRRLFEKMDSLRVISEINFEAAQANEAAARLAEDKAKHAAQMAKSEAEKARRAQADAQQQQAHAETVTRQALARDIAYKSETALRQGDRTTAFRLAEFAYECVDTNAAVVQALFDSYYASEDPDIARARLPWSFNLVEADKGATGVFFSRDGRWLLVDYIGEKPTEVWAVDSFMVKFKLSDGTGSHNEQLAFSTDGKRLMVNSSVILDCTGVDSFPVLFRKLRLFDEPNFIFSAQNGDNLAYVSDAHFSYCENLKISNLLQNTTEDIKSSRELAYLDISDDGKKMVRYNIPVKRLEIVDRTDNTTKRIAFPFYSDSINLHAASFLTGSHNLLLELYRGKESRFGINNFDLLILDQESEDTIAAFNQEIFITARFALSPSGSRMAIPVKNGQVKLLDLEKRTQEVIPSKGNTGITTIQFSQNGRWLGIATEDRIVRIWDVVNGTELVALSGHRYPVVSISFSPDERWIATCGNDGLVKCWAIPLINEPSQASTVNQEAFTCAAFSASGKNIVVAGRNKDIHFWSSETGAFQGWEFNNEILKAAISSEANFLALAHPNGRLTLWPELKLDSSITPIWTTDIGQNINSMAFSPLNRLLALGGTDHTATICNINNGQTVRRLSGHSGPINAIVFSPQGGMLGTASDDRTVRLWEMGKNLPIFTLEGHKMPVVTIAFSPDERQVATGSQDNTAIIWDIQRGTARSVLEGHVGAVHTIVYSPDQRRIATASVDGSIKIWDMETGALLLTLQAGSSKLLALCFADDSSILNAVTADGQIKSWILQPDILISRINQQERLSTLSSQQIAEYELANGLLLSEDWLKKLDASSNPPLIRSFARYFQDKTSLSNSVELVNSNYSRSVHLFEHLWAQTKDSTYLKDMANLYADWSFKELLADRDTINVNSIASKLASEAARYDAFNPRIHRQLANVYLMQGDFRRAIQLYFEIYKMNRDEYAKINEDIKSLINSQVQILDLEKLVRLLNFDLLDSTDVYPYRIAVPPYTTGINTLAGEISDVFQSEYCAILLKEWLSTVDDNPVEAYRRYDKLRSIPESFLCSINAEQRDSLLQQFLTKIMEFDQSNGHYDCEWSYRKIVAFKTHVLPYFKGEYRFLLDRHVVASACFKNKSYVRLAEVSAEGIRFFERIPTASIEQDSSLLVSGIKLYWYLAFASSDSLIKLDCASKAVKWLTSIPQMDTLRKQGMVELSWVLANQPDSARAWLFKENWDFDQITSFYEKLDDWNFTKEDIDAFLRDESVAYKRYHKFLQLMVVLEIGEDDKEKAFTLLDEILKDLSRDSSGLTTTDKFFIQFLGYLLYFYPKPNKAEMLAKSMIQIESSEINWSCYFFILTYQGKYHRARQILKRYFSTDSETLKAIFSVLVDNDFADPEAFLAHLKKIDHPLVKSILEKQ